MRVSESVVCVRGGGAGERLEAESPVDWSMCPCALHLRERGAASHLQRVTDDNWSWHAWKP